MSTTGRFGAGFLAGIILVALIAIVGNGDDPETVTTTTTTAAPVVDIEPWFAAGEVLIGSTVLLPQSLSIEEGIAYFDYELVGLAPTLFGDEMVTDLAMPAGDALALPESWELTTASGVTVSAETGPNQTSVKFELPDESAAVATIEITGWRIPAAFGDVVELQVEKGFSAELRRATVTVDAALEQSISTIVQVDVERTGDEWQSGINLRPLDPHWQVTGGASSGFQYSWNGPDAPGFITLEDVGYDMRPVTGRIVAYEVGDLP